MFSRAAQYWERKQLESARYGRRLGEPLNMGEWILGVRKTDQSSFVLSLSDQFRRCLLKSGPTIGLRYRQSITMKAALAHD